MRNNSQRSSKEFDFAANNRAKRWNNHLRENSVESNTSQENSSVQSKRRLDNQLLEKFRSQNKTSHILSSNKMFILNDLSKI